jgi:hypothetical protein
MPQAQEVAAAAGRAAHLAGNLEAGTARTKGRG